GELDWIVMKCLEKDRTRRYETADALARDVERYLHDEPVEACPPRAGYRLRKFLRRHRAGLLTAAGLVALLLRGAVLSTWQAMRAMWAEQAFRETQQERERADMKSEEADRHRARAEQQEALVRRLLYLSRINLADRAWQEADT